MKSFVASIPQPGGTITGFTNFEPSLVYRGTERISSNVLLNALEVGADPIVRQKVAKRKNFAPSPPLKKNPEFSPCPGGVGGTDRDAANALEVGPDPVIRQKVAKR